ncbi:MAG: hypothetical protein PW788_13730 [Micavibrio sp.]|nr:hypothetical protein [Micavibrio sp.]
MNAEITPRPARVAFLVPENPSHELLDAIFMESYSRWGGRRTPIIPTDGCRIAPSYLTLLDHWDADIIYCYVGLSQELADNLCSRFAPSEIQTHDNHGETDVRAYRPEYGGNVNFLSSLSLLPVFTRRTQIQGGGLPFILDKERWADIPRDLCDSFGFVSDSFPDNSLLPYALRLCYRPPHDRDIAPRFRGDHEISYVENADKLIEEIAKKRGLLTLSGISDMHCSYLYQMTHGRNSWEDRLTIVIGDTINDRLLFWNSQHFYRAGDGDDLGVLIFSPDRFQGDTPKWLKEWVSVRNHRHMDANAAPRIALRSCSVPEERLKEIAQTMGKNIMPSTHWHETPNLFEAYHQESSRETDGPYSQFPSLWAKSGPGTAKVIRMQENQLEVPQLSPWQMANFGQNHLSYGIWAVDLKIDRAEDHSPYSNIHHTWYFPRRLRMEQAISFKNYASARRGPIIPPNRRPTKQGCFTIWDSPEWSRPILTLPSDLQAFWRAIMLPANGSPEEQRAYAAKKPTERYYSVEVSDKGRDLMGVFQTFGSFPEAVGFLTAPYWLNVIRRLSPEEPEDKPKYVADIAEKIRNLVVTQPEGAQNFEGIAKRAISLASRTFVNADEKRKCATFSRLCEWALDGKEAGEKAEIKQQLVESVTYLRDVGFLWQGFQWTCQFCQHRNWVSLEKLQPVCECEICGQNQSSPVERGLDFILNPFVTHAFSSTSAQGPVVWCLGLLANRARQSFAFTPALNLFSKEGEVETDLDIIASVDGKTYIVEVKTSFGGVTEGCLQDLKAVVKKLRPDVVALAVYSFEAPSAEIKTMLERFQKDIEPYHTRFELMRYLCSDEVGISAPLAKKMKWFKK